MENLRDVLKATFKYVDIKTSSLFDENADDDFNIGHQKRILSDTLRKMRVNKTLDQIDAVSDLVFDNWRKKGDNSSLQYCEGDSVFNILLHFSSRVLSLRNGLPVCRYAHFLRWSDITTELGEDIFVTSFLASSDCKNNISDRSFVWEENIRHDNRSLNAVLDRNMSDLHAHLKGSSNTFYLNWLCLMNHIGSVEFDDTSIWMRKIMLDVVKACAIRYFLSMYLFHGINDRDTTFLNYILKAKDPSEVVSEVNELQLKITAYAHLYSQENSFNEILDYNYPLLLSSSGKSHDSDFLLSVFSGERAFMYKAFQYVYLNKEGYNVIARLLYVYLHSKTRFRSCLIQANNEPGFANFSEFQDRKSSFILKNSIYERLVPMMAVGVFLSKNPENRYLETRIAPQNNAAKQRKSLAKFDKDIRNRSFLNEIDKWQYYYILHFIKLKDTEDSLGDDHCRHYNLRISVYKQATAIYRLRCGSSPERYRVVGIDAANSELDCRPEVYAQAYRYLRCHPFAADDYQRPPDLGFTFHVGEDYYDVVDGLRAIDEVLHFLNFTDGDRLGHALVLGENVSDYYLKRNNTVVMPKQILLDNIVWLYVMSGELKVCYNAERNHLAFLYEDLYDDIFGRCSSCSLEKPSIFQYYQSWLLRGDDPVLYLKGLYSENSQCDRWNQYGINLETKACRVRANDVMAQKLYCRYHYDTDVKKRGLQKIELRVTADEVRMIDEVREMMLCKIEGLHLSVECNPTSNYKIGALPRYAVHPIVKFFNYQLETISTAPRHALNVSINTDDKGVFGTSLEREYSIMASALEKQQDYPCHDNPRQIYDWLDRVRQLGEESRFEHKDTLEVADNNSNM